MRKCTSLSLEMLKRNFGVKLYLVSLELRDSAESKFDYIRFDSQSLRHSGLSPCMNCSLHWATSLFGLVFSLSLFAQRKD